MLLALDIGNTAITIGRFEGADLVERRYYDTDSSATAADLLQIMQPTVDIDTMVVANVVRELDDALTEALASASSQNPDHSITIHYCNAHTAGDLFKTTYPNPAEIGADRIADAVALTHFYGAPAIVVDFGTATNIEVINNTGAFVGGIIAPGLKTSMDALFSHASKLDPVRIAEPNCVIGTSTTEAILSGIVFGEADRADGLIARAIDELASSCDGLLHEQIPVVATGGFCHEIAQYSTRITAVDRDLTLKGLQLIAAHIAQQA